MIIQVMQHVPFEGPGLIHRWAQSRCHELQVTHLYEEGPLPKLDLIEALVILGGPMSVHDEGAYKWLIAEKQLIRECIEAKKPTLGICLGSQLIAQALHAKVIKNEFTEIGWFPIELTAKARTTYFADLGDSVTAIHWHGDAFELPQGADLLASSKATKIQSYSYQDHILGILCHFEMGHDEIQSIVTHDADDLNQSGEYVQSAEEILEGRAIYCRAAEHALFRILDRFFGPR